MEPPKTSEYTLTVGLEIHAELKTLTKMFCNSKNDTNETRPNVNVCPVCMGHPGTLPVINKKAVESVLKVGVAVGGTIADYTEFDRKNYFYPDIPKGYQISQYKYPLVSGGSILGIEIERIHLEEDTAKSTHERGDFSLVDFNRAGVPLMELVTKPVIHTPADAMRFAKELQLLLRYLGVGDANMEKGEMRVEANISVSKDQTLGTKTEVKNLNSFSVVGKAIEYEMKRQIEALESGEPLVQETRGWDDAKGITYSQRTKEDSHDYRYFPDPDLPKIFISENPEWKMEALKATLPMLPWSRRDRYMSEFAMQEKVADFFVSQREYGDYLDSVIEKLNNKEAALLAINYISTDLAGLIAKENLSLPSLDFFSELMIMASGGELSSRATKDILVKMIHENISPRTIAERDDLMQKSDDATLTPMVQEILNTNPSVVAEYKAGKIEVIQFLLGQAMKISKGSANPNALKVLFEKMLS